LLACVADCWHVARSVSGDVQYDLFYNDIGAFVSIGRFPTNELGQILFFLINENESLLPCFFFNNVPLIPLHLHLHLQRCFTGERTFPLMKLHGFIS
jgi:hypothetical protein